MPTARPSIRRSLTVSALLLCTVPLLGASCVSNGDDDYTSRDRDTDVSSIPSNAKKVAEGRGKLVYKAASNGQVYLYDADKRTVVYNTDLLEGDTFGMNTSEDRIYINGKKDKQVRLVSENTYRVYFDGRRSGGRDRDDDRPDRDPVRPVPDHAKVMDEARGRDLSFKAPGDGKAYLYDATASQLVKTFSIRRGQRLTISPANGVAALDGKTIAKNQSYNRRNTYRLLFAD